MDTTALTLSQQWPPNTSVARPLWTQSYVQGVSELIATHLRPHDFTIAHKPTQSLTHIKSPLQSRDIGMLCIVSIECNVLTKWPGDATGFRAEFVKIKSFCEAPSASCILCFSRRSLELSQEHDCVAITAQVKCSWLSTWSNGISNMRVAFVHTV